MIKINDALTLSAIAGELNKTVTGLRITKVIMPDKNTVTLVLYDKSLVLKTGESAAVYLSSDSPKSDDKNAGTAGVTIPFAAQLKKRLSGGIIKEFVQPAYERVLGVKIEAENDLRDAQTFFLFIELLGKYSNIILTDEERYILGSLKQSDAAEHRPVMSGLEYAFPVNPASEEYIKTLLNAELNGENTYKSSDSPMTGGGAWDDRHKISAARFIKAFSDKAAPSNKFLFEKARTVNEAADIYYTLKIHADIETGEKQRYAGKLENLLKAVKRQAADAAETLEACEGYEKDRFCGDILTNNFHNVKTGAASVKLVNYKDGTETEIELDPRLTPQANAAKYYKAYTKKQRQHASALAVKNETGRIISEAQGLLSLLAAAKTPEERQNAYKQIDASKLINEKASKAKNAKGKKAQAEPLKPDLVFGGFEIYIGKNDTQNETITFRMGRKNDVWLHATGIQGCHVLIKAQNRQVPMPVVMKAAAAAAYGSKASVEDKAAVDYTLWQYVKKQKGGKPGQVTYSAQKTLFAIPERLY